jgi:hypothetical protein
VAEETKVAAQQEYLPLPPPPPPPQSPTPVDRGWRSCLTRSGTPPP